MKIKRFMTTVMLLSAFAAFAGTQSGKATDQLIQSMVEHELAKNKLLVDNNIQVSVADNVITLNGIVPTIAARQNAEQEAKKVEEEYGVQNDLVVKYIAVPDSKLVQTVQDRIDNYGFYTMFDWVTADVDSGVVTLRGWAHLPWTARQIEAQVNKVENVRKVVNQIQFVMGSDDLRYHAALAIYTNPLFEWYVYRHNNPPVHIVVDGPNILLEGLVQTEPEKNWAGILADFNSGALHVVNNLKVAKK
jgi:hyperosmotically inducible protein